MSNWPEALDGGDLLLSIEKDKANTTSYQALLVVLLEKIEFNFPERIFKISYGIFIYKK